MKRIHSLLLGVGLVGAAFFRNDYGATLIRQLSDRFVFAQDSQIYVAPLMRFRHPLSLGSDRISDYLSKLCPSVFVATYRFGLLFCDGPALAKAFTCVLWVLTLFLIGLTLRNLTRNRVVPWIGVAWAIVSGLLLTRMAGGIERTFGLPSLALAGWALSTNRPRWLLVSMVAGFAYYPPIGLVIGLTTLLIALEDRRFFRSIRAPFVTASVLSGFLMLPTVWALRTEGELIRQTDWAEFPEAGLGGRYAIRDLNPISSQFAEALVRDWKEAVYGMLTADRTHTAVFEPYIRSTSAHILFWSVVLLSAFGMFGLMRRRSEVRHFLYLLPASLIGYVASYLFHPYLFLPQRMVAYSVPIVVLVIVCTGLYELAVRISEKNKTRWVIWPLSAILAAYAGIWIFPGVGRTGFDINETNHRELYRLIQKLPEGSIVAGWPGGLIDAVPYLSYQPAFLTRKTHQAFHRTFVLEMRARMQALIEAVLSADPGALLSLRKSFGVSYFIVDPGIRSAGSLWYFEPFSQSVRSAMKKLGNHPLSILTIDSRAVIYADGRTKLIDLEKLQLLLNQGHAGSSQETSAASPSLSRR